MTEIPDLSYMSAMTPEQQEAERTRLIEKFLGTLDPARRQKIAEFQNSLDGIRDACGRDAMKTIAAFNQLALTYIPVLSKLEDSVYEHARQASGR